MPTLLEALLVLIVGSLAALVANQLSPRGLSVTRDYFHGSTSPLKSVLHTNTASLVAGGQTNLQAALSNATFLRLQAKGIQVADSNLVKQFFHDLLHAQELIIFIDARNDREFQEGHVPGAYQFNHYRPADHLATVLPACQMAEKIVVYCNGGDCEDSEFASITLKEAGVPATKLFVYPGGFHEWTTNALPIEIGPRKSGVLREGSK